MRRSIAVPALLVSVVAASGLSLAARGQDPPTPPVPPKSPAGGGVALTIVHTNDLHAHLENFAAVAQVAKDARARNPNTLFLDGGDCITGTVASTVFQGTPVFDVMNSMGYDAGVIGNHEFDHGWRKVHEFTELARHPLLCANAKDPDGKAFGDAPYKILECGGVRVGVIGLLTGDLAAATTAAATKGVVVEAPVAAARRLVPEVRAKADLVVLLTHCGVEVDAALAGSVPGIDLIVGGHSHTRLANELTIEPHGTRVVQAWCYGRQTGVIDLTYDGAQRKIATFAWRKVATEGKGAPAGDPAVQKAVDAWEGKLRAYDEAIGRTAADLSKAALRPMIERIYRETLGADIGYQNLRGIRDVVNKGDIRMRDVFSVLPFENTLWRVRVKGARLPAYQQRELGARFDPEKEYVIATNSYCADHRDRYFGSKDLPAEDTGLPMRDTVIAWVRKHGGFVPKGEAAPDPDERDDP